MEQTLHSDLMPHTKIGIHLHTHTCKCIHKMHIKRTYIHKVMLPNSHTHTHTLEHHHPHPHTYKYTHTQTFTPTYCTHIHIHKDQTPAITVRVKMANHTRTHRQPQRSPLPRSTQPFLLALGLTNECFTSAATQRRDVCLTLILKSPTNLGPSITA